MTTKINKKQDWLKLNKRTGELRPTRRFEGGAFDALTKRPISLLKQDSLYRRILGVLESYKNEPLTTKQITTLHNERHKENKTKAQSINARLSELFTYSLVVHYEDKGNAGAGFWSLADGIDVSDGQSLYDKAVNHTKKLKNKRTWSILQKPKNKRVLTE